MRAVILALALTCARASGAELLGTVALEPELIVSSGQTIVASAVATRAPFGADAAGERDASRAIQAAIDAVAGAGGGVVSLPAGQYRLESPLRLAYAVTLMGAFPRSGTAHSPTVLVVWTGHGDADGPALITLPPHRETAVRNVTVWYPDQRPAALVPYPPAFAGGTCRLDTITLVNAYHGVRLDLANACVIADIRGTVLARGIEALKSTEFSWMRDVAFASDTWRTGIPALGIAPLGPDGAALVEAQIRDHLVGLELGRIDCMAIDGFSARDARTPVLIRKRDHVSQHRVHGFGGVVHRFPTRREEHAWDPWYYGMYYAHVDAVPEAAHLGRAAIRRPPMPTRADAASFLNVRQAPFAAAGDGIADDTAVIARALDAAGALGGGTVYLPPGCYRVTRPLTVPTGVELRGPLGTGSIRQAREPCSLAVHWGGDVEDAAGAPAAVTLAPAAGIRGFTIVYPEQPYDPGGLRAFPYAIRGAGSGVWVVDMHLLGAWHGIDLGTHRCDRHVVSGVWGTVFGTGLYVGGGSRHGTLERVAFSYGPWAEAGRHAELRTPQRVEAIAAAHHRHAEHVVFGECIGETTWGLVGFYPKTHVRFADEGHGCRDSTLWLSMFDVARDACLQIDAAAGVDMIGVFSTGGRSGRWNWFETGVGMRGPVRIMAPTVQQTFLNHPIRSTPQQVQVLTEASLTWQRPVTASACNRESRPEHATDRAPHTRWQAPAGAVLTVDLGEVCELTRFRIENEGLYGDARNNTHRADLWGSVDGATFESLAVLWTQGRAWADMPLEEHPRARYVQLRVVEPGADGVIRVAQFDVFGTVMR